MRLFVVFFTVNLPISSRNNVQNAIYPSIAFDEIKSHQKFTRHHKYFSFIGITLSNMFIQPFVETD
jgi:hypothetical protein